LIFNLVIAFLLSGEIPLFDDQYFPADQLVFSGIDFGDGGYRETF